jgi:hypothetical protein
MQTATHCAYNETRECFLGLEVEAADLSYASLQARLQAMPLRSGQGLWLSPFRGISTSGVLAALDLLYLDEDHRVIETVESFPIYQASASNPKAASVLALPAHSIYSSQTQQGDQLLLCRAEEMSQRLERLSQAGNEEGEEQSAAILREEPLWSGGPGLLQLDSAIRKSGRGTPQMAPRETLEIPLVASEPRFALQRKNWLRRWWSPDPRKAPREPVHGLAAYYWNGGPPRPYEIKDISATGLYVVTEERWYPGTLVLMNLRRTAEGEESTECSIATQTRAVRWGKDGVGLQFVLTGEAENTGGNNGRFDGAKKKELERFLRRLKKRS